MRECSVSSAETSETMFSPRRAISRCVSASSTPDGFADAGVPFAGAAGAPNEKPAKAGFGAAGAAALAGGAVKEKPPNCVVSAGERLSDARLMGRAIRCHWLARGSARA